MFLAMILSAYLLGTVLPYIVKKDPAAEAYQRKRKDLITFANAHELPTGLVNKMLQYYEFQYSKVRHSASQVQLTRTLQIKVANKKFRHYVDRNMDRGLCFHRCEANFISALVCLLKELYLMPAEEFIRCGDVSRELYFVADGVVQLIDGQEVKRKIRGDVADMASVVGEVSFFLGIPQAQAARTSADTDVRLLILTKDNSEKLLAQFPEQQELILKNILASYNLDAHGRELVEGQEEEDASRQLQQHVIIVAMKRRESEAFTALSHAATMGDVEEVRRLIRRGADINSTNYDHRTVLHMACSEGNLRVAEALLENGAGHSLKSRWGRTALSEAVHAKQGHIVQELLKHNCRLLLDDPAGEMCDFASQGDIDNLNLLLNNGVDPNQGDYDGRTPLHLACAEGNNRVAELLVSFKADVNIKDRWGGTPLKDAVVEGHTVVATSMRSRGGRMPEGIGAQEMCTASSEGDVARMRMLLSCGVDPDEGDYDSRTPLHLACAAGKIMAVSFLLGASATPNMKDRWNASPMDDCVRGQTLYHVYCAKMLQGWGGDLSVYKNTPEGSMTLGGGNGGTTSGMGEEFMRQMNAANMEQVTAVMKKMVAWGDNRKAVTSDDDLKVAKDASGILIPRYVDIRRTCDKGVDCLQQVQSGLDMLVDALRLFMQAFADVQDDRVGVEFLERIGYAANKSSDEGSARKQLEVFFDELQTAPTNTEIVLAGIVDDETYALYEEIDLILADKEQLESNSWKSKAQIAKIFISYLMRINQVESMHQTMCSCFAGSSQKARYLTLSGLMAALKEIGWRISLVQAEEMLSETDAYDPYLQRARIGVAQLLFQSASFRTLLLSGTGSCFGADQLKWVHVSKCKPLSVLPIWWQIQSLSNIKVKRCKKGAKLLSEGRTADDLYIIKKGELAQEQGSTQVGTLRDGDVCAQLEFFCGSGLAYSLRATCETTVYAVEKETVAKAFEDDQGAHIPLVVRELVRFLETATKDATTQQVAQGFLKPEEIIEDEFMKILSSAVWDNFCPRAIQRADPESKPISFFSDVLPGLNAVFGSWEALADGKSTISVESVLDLDGFMGSHTHRVGDGFFVSFKQAMHKIIENRILKYHDEHHEEQEDDWLENMRARLKRSFSGNLDAVHGDEAKCDEKKLLEISEGIWWECWMYTLQISNDQDPSSSDSIGAPVAHRNPRADDTGGPDLEDETELEIGVFDEAWAYISLSRITPALLSKQVIDRYEPAYLLVVGNLTESMRLRQIPEILQLLFPKRTRKFGAVNVAEFLRMFAKDGLESTSVQWSSIRKVTRERARELAAEDTTEYLFSEGSGLVFNEASLPIHVWFLMVSFQCLSHASSSRFMICTLVRSLTKNLHACLLSNDGSNRLCCL